MIAPAPTPVSTTHPIAELRAARAELLAAVQGRRPSDLLIPDAGDGWCGRDVLLHLAAGLRELLALVPDLAAQGRAYYGTTAQPPRSIAGIDPPVQAEPYGADGRAARPEAALAAFVTAHARLLDRAAKIDEAGLRRRGPALWNITTSGWELLQAEAAHEQAHAARLAARSRGRIGPAGDCHSRGAVVPVLRAC